MLNEKHAILSEDLDSKTLPNKECLCAYCNSKQRIILFEKNKFEIFKCKNCGLVYAANSLSSEELADFYSREYFMGSLSRFGYINYLEEGNYNTINHKKIVDNIVKHVAKGKILDMGCASGSFLRLFNNNWEKHGIDISNYITNYAKELADCRIFEGELINFLHSSESFDVITFLDSLDHMRDPIANLRIASKLLKRNGLIVITCGDSDSLMAKVLRKRWYLYIPPTHLFFFSRKVLAMILSSMGFKIKRIEYSGKWVSLRLCFFRLSYIYPNFLSKMVYSFFKKHNLLGKLKLYYNFKDVMTIYATKI